MIKKRVSGGVAHKVPADLKRAISFDFELHSKWESLTPLARNEWICWVISVKRQETRKKHIERLLEQLNEGVRRPCCWYGCIHRKDKPPSPWIRKITRYE